MLILWLTSTAKSYRSPYWLTFKQALDLGGHVRKGEKGAPVCYYDTFTKETVDDTGASREERIPFLKHYTAFNAEQCDGLPARFHPPASPEPTPDADAGRIAAVDRFIADLGAESSTVATAPATRRCRPHLDASVRHLHHAGCVLQHAPA